MVLPLLAQRGIATDVVTLADHAGCDDGVRRLLRRQPRLLRIPRTVAVLAAAARRADIVLAAGLWAESAIAARLARRPLVVRVPGDPAWERAVAVGRPESLAAFQAGRLPPRWAALRAARTAWARAADQVLVPSRFLAGLVAGWGVPESRIVVIRNAVPVAPPPAATVPDHDLVWLGRMVAQKRLPALIEAARRAGASLLLAGDGPCRPDPAPGITLPGLSGPDVLRRGRIFVQASSYEGLPHAVLEAKARGLPVVATDAGGTAECVRHGIDGVLVPPGDDAALATAIRALLDDPALAARMGAAGREDALARFSPHRMADALDQLLRAVVAGRASRG
jgi:glycosyltransferase involved in cell wall biosynthesis